jgi:receptor protein-tyrosine kinase
MQTGGYEVVQAADAPLSPDSPRPLRNAFFAVIGGLLAGVLIAFVVDRADRRLKTPETVEERFGVPVLATVPQIRRLDPKRNGKHGRGIGFTDQSFAFAESFRTLRSNLKYFELDRRIRTIVITSALPAEGKTLTAVNLAISLALSGASVTVIEADLRRPRIQEYFGLKDGVGVSNFLAGSHALAEATRKIVIDPSAVGAGTASARSLPHREHYFYCITSGPLPPNPAELIGSQRMRALIDQVAQVSDYVLVDTPPILVVADAASLMNMADGTLVCARLQKTTTDDARRVRALLERTNARVLGVVASGVKLSAGKDRYGYSYAPREYDAQPALWAGLDFDLDMQGQSQGPEMRGATGRQAVRPNRQSASASEQ